MITRSSRLGLVLAGLSVLLTSAGCNRKLQPDKPGATHRPGDVVARADGHTLTWADADKRARSYLKDEAQAQGLYIPPNREDELLPRYRLRAVVLFVNKTVMLDEAKRRGIRVTDDDRKASLAMIEPILKKRGVPSIEAFYKQSPLGEKETRREFEEGLFVDKLIDQDVRSKIVIADADRDAVSRELSLARQTARKKIDGLRAQLVKGADFAALARDNSDDGSKRAGGDLGEFPRGRMEKAFEDAAFGQKINEIGPVVETRFGYHIIKVTAHTAAKPATATAPATPETVRVSHILVSSPPPGTGKDIDNLIRRRKLEAGMKSMLEGLRSKAKIDTIYKEGPNALQL